MEECSKCGISGERARLFDALSEKERGIVKVCERCSLSENLPTIKKPTTFQLKESERKQTIYEKLSRAAGINPDEHKENISEEKKRKVEELKKQETTLKDLIDKNLQIKIPKNKKPREHLIENFHWIILRGRKIKHLAISQLADAIGESETVLKMAEQGMLPEDDFRLINKLENFLDIRIRKKGDVLLAKKEPARVLKFKPDIIQNLTISDLQRMKKMREEREFFSDEPEKEKDENIEEMEKKIRESWEKEEVE